MPKIDVRGRTVVLLSCLFLCPCYNTDGGKATARPATSAASPAAATSASNADPPAALSAASERIVLHFPQDKPVGKLVLLKMRKNRQSFSEEPYAMAQGDITVLRGALVLLEVNYHGAADLSFLKGLPSGVIAGLRIEKLAITDEQFMALGGMKYIKLLDLSDVDITDRGIMHIKECKGLLELSLHSSRITGKGLEAVRDMQQLVSLSLDYNDLGDASMANISGLKNLIWLRLKATGIGDAGIAHLKDLPHLKKLIVFANKRVTDASIPYILALPSLIRLDLTDCKISAAGLMKLKKSPSLTQIEFAYRDYPAGQLDQIKRALAPCKVVDGHSSNVPLEVFSPLH